jgi:hypothetical protein
MLWFRAPHRSSWYGPIKRYEPTAVMHRQGQQIDIGDLT